MWMLKNNIAQKKEDTKPYNKQAIYHNWLLSCDNLISDSTHGHTSLPVQLLDTNIVLLDLIFYFTNERTKAVVWYSLVPIDQATY